MSVTVDDADRLRLALVALQRVVDTHEDSPFRMMTSFAELKDVREDSAGLSQ